MAQVMGVEDLSGRLFGRYELRDQLGHGAMGAVYRAYDTSLKRIVAVKVLLPELAAQPESRERFEREAEIAASLEHPHIITVHDYGLQEGYSYIVMRLLMGGSLEDWLKASKAPLSLNEATRLLNEQAKALDYAHNKGIIHRDIKASNVVLGDQYHSYLSDFGIAKLRDTNADFSLTQDGVILGTYRYLAPERWEGKDATPASDLYALGILAYALLTGRLPFEAASPAELMRQHLYQQPAPVQNWRPELPKMMNSVLRTAMAKRTQERYPSATAFADAFYQAIEGGSKRRTTQRIVIVDKTPEGDITLDGPTTPLPSHPLSPNLEDSLPDRRKSFRYRLGGYLRRGVVTLFIVLLILAGLVAALLSRFTPPTPLLSVTPVDTATAPSRVTTSPPGSILLAVSNTPTPPPTRTPAATFTTAITATALPLVCPYSPPSRLAVGDAARVIVGQAPNIIREAPNTSSARLGEIPAGQIFTVLDGPECGPTIGRMWWQISYQGISGWTTEGSGDTYFLEPVVGTPGAVQPSPTDTPWPPPSAFVTPVQQTMSGALENETDSAVYSFVWQRDAAIQIEVESLDFDTFLTLQYPDGSLLTDDDSAGELDSRIGPIELPTDGSYTIRISTYNRLFGDFTLTYTDYSICGHLPIAIVEGGDIRLHTGPGIFDPILRLAQRGECLAIVGRSADDQWLNVNTISGHKAWISTSVAEMVGDIERAPVINS